MKKEDKCLNISDLMASRVGDFFEVRGKEVFVFEVSGKDVFASEV